MMPNNIRTPSPSMRSTKMRSQSPHWTPNPLRHPSPLRSNRSGSASRRDCSSPSVVIRSSSNIRPNNRPFPKELLSSSMMAGVDLSNNDKSTATNTNYGRVFFDDKKNVSTSNKSHKLKINQFLGLSSSSDDVSTVEDNNNYAIITMQDNFSPEMCSPTTKNMEKKHIAKAPIQKQDITQESLKANVEVVTNEKTQTTPTKIEDKEPTFSQDKTSADPIKITTPKNDDLIIINLDPVKITTPKDNNPIDTKKKQHSEPNLSSKGKDEQINAIESKLSELKKMVNRLESSPFNNDSNYMNDAVEDCRDDILTSSQEHKQSKDILSMVKQQVTDIQQLFADLKHTISQNDAISCNNNEEKSHVTAHNRKNRSNRSTTITPIITTSTSPCVKPIKINRTMSPTIAKVQSRKDNDRATVGEEENYMASLDNNESLSAIIARLQRSKLR